MNTITIAAAVVTWVCVHVVDGGVSQVGLVGWAGGFVVAWQCIWPMLSGLWGCLKHNVLQCTDLIGCGLKLWIEITLE